MCEVLAQPDRITSSPVETARDAPPGGAFGDGRGPQCRRAVAAGGDRRVTARFAFYGRLSTDDKQDHTLARPSQLDACSRKASELGSEIVVEYFDQESGAKDERPGWTSLTREARDPHTRRFDHVVIYQT